jgi:hypothetical protein
MSHLGQCGRTNQNVMGSPSIGRERNTFHWQRICCPLPQSKGNNHKTDAGFTSVLFQKSVSSGDVSAFIERLPVRGRRTLHGGNVDDEQDQACIIGHVHLPVFVYLA